ncbi:MAG: hypothetical protein H0X51_07035 [Parachlamydiaceae bacterium]|nr:hypothetical protein [Parachlamydiaceae bacterium]
MDVSRKDHLTTTEKTFTLHPEVSLTSVTNVVVKVLTEETKSHVAKKPPPKWGEVVVLVGTSTAGKTSIISELVKQKPEMIERGIDSAWVGIPLNYLNKHHPEEMAFLEKVIEPAKDDIENYGYILSYVETGREPKFKTGVSVKEKDQYQEVVKKLYDSLCKGIPGDTPEKYAQSIITCMMDEIILESKQGRPIACDILQVNEVALETVKIKVPSVKFALVYVPFQTLAERVIKRNNKALSEGNFGDARPGVFPLEQFTKLFRPRNDSDLDSEIVQKLTLGEVKHAIDTVFENSKTFLKSTNQSLDELEKKTVHLRGIILERFGFKEGDDPNKVVELTPSYKGYHMLINTARGDKSKSEVVQEAVKQILVKD